MNILIPATRKPLWSGGEIVPIDPHDETDYWEFWRDTWAKRQTVIVVEHDVIPSVIALKSLWHCPMGWCTQPYNYLRITDYHGLGCVKFSGRLMELFPDLWERVGEMSDDLHRPMHWCRLDAWATSILTDLHANRHEHALKVKHPIHERSAHGCV